MDTHDQAGVLNRVLREDAHIADMRARIARIGALMYQRHLTDAAGGNISARVSTSAGDVICMSPRYAGSKWLWQLNAEDVLVVSLDGQILLGAGEISRESKVHLRLHNEFGSVGKSVIHAHARNLLAFAALARSMPPVLEATRKFGTLPVIDFAPSHSATLSINVAAALRGLESRITKHAAGVIAPYHGLFVMGKDLNAAFDAVERIDNNAYIILMSGLLDGDRLAEQTAALEAAIANFKESSA